MKPIIPLSAVIVLTGLAVQAGNPLAYLTPTNSAPPIGGYFTNLTAVPATTNWPATNRPYPHMTNWPATNLPALTNPPALQPPGGP